MNPSQIFDAWHAAARSLLPGDTEVWDGHSHTGANDPDGVVGKAEDLVASLLAAGHRGAVVMTSRDAHGYRAANDRVAAEATASDGVLIPFLRIDPNDGTGALREVERSLALGHRGIKLHPRGEAFQMSDPTVRRVAEAAAHNGVPILVHAGRGIPSLGREVVELCDAVDGLRIILAHAAISDLSSLGPIAKDIPGLYIDTSWWDATDLLALFAWVPPGRIVYASDTPYGSPARSFTLTLRAAASAGYSPDQLRGLFGGTLMGVLAGSDGEDLGPPAGDEVVSMDPGLLRVHSSLHGAIVRTMGGGDNSEPLSLARAACAVPPGTNHESVFAAITTTLDAVEEAPSTSETVWLILLAATAALTPEVALPELLVG